MVIRRCIRWPRKEFKKSYLFKKYEINKLIIKSLLNNNYIKFYPFQSKYYFMNLFYNFPINSSSSKRRTYCMLQLEGQSIFRYFKLSRYMMNYSLNNGLIIGIRKASF